jgi:hypothetical protein
MNHVRRILAALAGVALALAAAPAAFAQPYPPPGQLSKYEPVAHHFNGVAGGMPGWQMTLIAIGAALVGAAVAILAARGRVAHKAHATTA